MVARMPGRPDPALLVAVETAGCAPTVDVLGVHLPGRLDSTITGVTSAYVLVFARASLGRAHPGRVRGLLRQPDGGHRARRLVALLQQLPGGSVGRTGRLGILALSIGVAAVFGILV